MEQHSKVIDVLAGGTIVASIAGWLPPIAALLSILWYAWLFWDKIKRRFFNDPGKDRRRS